VAKTPNLKVLKDQFKVVMNLEEIAATKKIRQ